MNSQPAIELRLDSPPYVMGILNCTPDSFSDGGAHLQPADAIRAVETELSAADIIDVGGEASGPHSKAISADEELSRIGPIVKQLAPTQKLSIDTFRATTAAACLAAGAQMINDISALRFDDRMAKVVGEHDAFVVLMYSKEDGAAPHVSNRPARYRNIVLEIGDFLEARVEFALAQGISERRIVIDPGMGAFVSQDPEDSWELLASLDRLSDRFVKLPMLVGTSRKGFLGGALSERDPLSQLTALVAAVKGATILRTHQPRMAKSFLKAWARTMSQKEVTPQKN